MSFLADNLIPIFKKRELLFKESYREAEDVRTFVFEKENDLSWKAGQYGLFTITHKKMKKGTKPFSLSSAPAENVVRITTRIPERPSDFKRALSELKTGMKVSMSGPLGPFYLKEQGPVLFVAGGIGITPFRSMLQQLQLTESQSERPVKLLYLDGAQSHIYRSELDGYAADSAVDVQYLNLRDELHAELDRYATLHADGRYFVAGPKSMVDAVTVYLQNKKIPKRNIVKDAFFGY
ncbi:FAD-dependent oxidoreductase [Saccharibacillus endophyticus]|uniref:Oxidoreductase n=1 Tax=Saccharibacillus endophyticus TaxID=2060666 RepID=A0ABQ1ZZZ8_9BACL|nr:FAD-dependent oxidoreductase [Saccharibacillus endophyticus]GGH82892.1 oxidoreductase [Saccharibacillus endophyticus]